MKCKVLTQNLKIPLLRFGDRILLSQPINDISNLYLLCACVTKNGSIIGPILHKDQDIFRQQLKSHESGLVSYELPTGKASRNLRDRLSSFGPTIRTRNGLPFDRDSPAGTDPVFFWILEKHSDRIWGSTQVFVVGCKKSSFFKDHMSPSTEEILKRKLIPLPLDPIEGLPTNINNPCIGSKPLVLLWDSLVDDVHNNTLPEIMPAPKRSSQKANMEYPIEKRQKISDDSTDYLNYQIVGNNQVEPVEPYPYVQLMSSYQSPYQDHSYQITHNYDSFNHAPDLTHHFINSPYASHDYKDQWFTMSPTNLHMDDNLLTG